MESHNTVHLTDPSNERHEISSVNYTAEGYTFHESYTRNPLVPFVLGNEDIAEVYEENGRIHFTDKNGGVWKLAALINEDVSNGIEFGPGEEELPEDDDIYRLMWKRAEAIAKYINNQLCIDEDAKIKVACHLHAEMDLQDYIPDDNGEYDKNPIIIYDYSYRLRVVNGNPKKPAAWIKDVYVSQFASNEEALAALTRQLIRDRLPADKQYDCFSWDEEYGKYDDENNSDNE